MEASTAFDLNFSRGADTVTSCTSPSKTRFVRLENQVRTIDVARNPANGRELRQFSSPGLRRNVSVADVQPRPGGVPQIVSSASRVCAIEIDPCVRHSAQEYGALVQHAGQGEHSGCFPQLLGGTNAPTCESRH